MEVLESTFVAGTRREAAADGGGRRADPPGLGEAGMLLEARGFGLGGLDERAGGGPIFGAASLAFGDGSRLCSGSDVFVMEPLLKFDPTPSCGFDQAGSGFSCAGPSKVIVGFSSRRLSLYV